MHDTIDNIVKEFLFESGETTLHKYSRYLSYALSEARDWHFDCAQEVKTLSLPIDAINQVDLPRDYVDWVKVGIQCGDKIKILHLNEHMAMVNQTDKCGVIPFDKCNCDANNLPANYEQMGAFPLYGYSNNGHTGMIYGYGSGYLSKQYFQIYKDKQKIQLSADISKDLLYLEYISTGFSPCEATVINPYAKEVIKAAIDFKRLWHSKDSRYGDAKMMLEEKRLQARHRIFAITKEDILQISRKYAIQAPKG